MAHIAILLLTYKNYFKTMNELTGNWTEGARHAVDT